MAERDKKGRFISGGDAPAEAEIAPDKTPMPIPEEPPPRLRVQRMGKNFRIVYEDTRNLARFNSGKAVDDGGFKEELDARIHLAKVTGGPGKDAEEESVE